MTQIVTVLGAGYVGLSTAALLSTFTKVFLVEPDRKKYDLLLQGKSFFYEHGIDELLQKGLQSNLLHITQSYEEAIPESDIVFSCVGTPDLPDGSSNLSYAYAAAAEAARLLKHEAVFVQKSTVPVGTGDHIINTCSIPANQYVSNPEFLREGTSVADLLWFDRVICGSYSKDSAKIVLSLYQELTHKRHELSKEFNIPVGNADGKFITTDLKSAELIKVSANAFLALKISFANSIAKLSDAVGANINEVMDGIGADERIGRKFLNAGRGYGGGCFPKDVSGLISAAETVGIPMEIMTAAQSVNQSMPDYIIDKLLKRVSHSNLKVLVLGLSFKEGTSDVRKSPGIAIANKLSINPRIQNVAVYDPKANKEASSSLNDDIHIIDGINEEIINQYDVIVIATSWKAFKPIYDMAGNNTYVVDAVNMLDSPNSANYIGIGRD